MDLSLFVVQNCLRDDERAEGSSVVGILIDETTECAGAFVPPQDEPPQLVREEDEEGEGKGRHPPLRLQRVEPDILGQHGGVDEQDGQQGLEQEGHVEDPVGEALGQQGHIPSLADQQVGPLGLNKAHK